MEGMIGGGGWGWMWLCASFFVGMFAGHGNSLHGTGTRGTQHAQLLYSLRLLLNMCNTEVELIHQDLHEQGAIPILISKCEGGGGGGVEAIQSGVCMGCTQVLANC